jgi:hypothetical protein
MLIQVDVQSLINNLIKIDEFVVLQLVYDKQYELISKYLSLYDSEEKKKLFDRFNLYGFVTNYNNINEYDPSKLTLEPDFLQIIANGDFFDELVQVFPVSVTRPDGTKDFLRNDLKRCKVTYSKITKNKYFIHQHILECLRYEVALKRKEGKMSYFKRLSKWLASEEWKIYEQALNESTIDSLTNSGDLGYGNSLE